MKLASLRTIRSAHQRNVCLVQLTWEDGVQGLGESFYAASAVETYLHDDIAPILLGLDSTAPEDVRRALRPYTGYQGGGVELRANGAIDMALWDGLGKRAGLSLSALLGGASSVDVPVYNTCAGTRYVSTSAFQRVDNWGADGGDEHEDLIAFMTEPRRLARELRDLGYVGMKVWPFDPAAEASGGVDIGRHELASGVRIIADIRDEVGDDLEIMVELHALWSVRGAAKILKALEPYDPYWAEDPLLPDNIAGLRSLKDASGIPLALGETSVGQRQFQALLTSGVVDIATVDVGWTGGLTEARKVANLCESYGVPVAPHDCTGPVSLAVAAHLTNSSSNGLVQETARAFLHSWYPDFVQDVPEVKGGRLTLPDAPGHGLQLRPGIEKDDHISIRQTPS